MRVLFISQWYPHRYDAMEGLFVRKHAEAVSLHADVCVLFVYDDEKIKKTEIIKNLYNSVTEYTIYYPINKKNPFYKIIKVFKFLNAYRKGFKNLKKEGFKPDIIHANVLTRTPFIAYLYKMFTKTPYVITEHWSRFLKIRNQFNGFLRKRLAKVVVKNADCIMPVSANLQDAMIYRHSLKNDNYKVISNVVEDYFFQLPNENRKNDKKQIIHISCFDEKAKNIRGILRVIKEISKKRDDFEMVFVGTGINFDEIYQYYLSLKIPTNIVQFTGELTPQEVYNKLSNSNFSILFSNYENTPVVISESLACGKPVISTDVGGISEHINDKNGILIPPKDEKQLKKQIIYMLDHYQKYNENEISKKAKERYSYNKIGKKLFDTYKKSIK